MLIFDLYAVHLSLHDNTSVGKVPKFGKVGILSNFDLVHKLFKGVYYYLSFSLPACIIQGCKVFKGHTIQGNTVLLPQHKICFILS